MKNVSKNKLFLCFRPVVDIDVMLDSTVAVDRSSTRRFASCAPVSDKDQLKISQNSMPPKQSLSRLIKAMVFETILNRRTRRKHRYRQDSCGSNRSYSTYTEETSSTGDDKSIWSQTSVDSSYIQEIHPESQFSSEESKYLCKSKSYPCVGKQRKKSHQDPLEKRRKKLDYSGIYLFLLCLTLTVLWGKILGVILTSICLYAYSIWNARNRKTKEASKSTKTESKVHRHRSRGHEGRLK